ncbi:MAG: endonuclease/exonuclease/phosphatase family protein [Rhodopirellula sp. JB055]|uniref:endonuclease/exonuclease/phosphatase family protein n=1 Tax=Rhodopirellula sp. JB055 TaxID=3342846 RepID=UPI00370BE89D
MVIQFLWKLLWGNQSKSRRRSSRSSGSILRWFTPGISITGVIGLVIAALTGQVDLPSLDTLRGSEAPVYDDPLAASLTPEQMASRGYAGKAPIGEIAPVSLTTPASATSRKPDASIRVATFNIQVFGKSKSEKPEVMRRLAQVCMLFDVVAVQEIKGDPKLPINGLLDEIASLGGRYNATVSEPQGRTSQTERYGFVWDTDRIDLIPESDYLVSDEMDRMHRAPMVASFQTRVTPTPTRMPFRFTLINVHTDPDEVGSRVGDTPKNEMNVLDDVFHSVRMFEYQNKGEEDFVLMGDLNVETQWLLETGRIPNIQSLVGDQPTNTLQTKTYDHLLIDTATTREFTGRAGVLNLKSTLQISEEDALKVSDHMPVWAEFSVFELPPR